MSNLNYFNRLEAELNSLISNLYAKSPAAPRPYIIKNITPLPAMLPSSQTKHAGDLCEDWYMALAKVAGLSEYLKYV